MGKEPDTGMDAIYRLARAAAGIEDTGESDGANADLRAQEIAPGIRCVAVRTPTLPPAVSTNCYVVGGRELVVIDPASPYAAERAAVDRVIDAWCAEGARVVEIWLTHHHADHVGGAVHLARRLGVPMAAHAETARLLGSRVPVDRLLDHGDTRELGGEPRCRVRAVFTPGHAPGHLCVLEEITNTLIAGDMVAGVGTIVVEPSEGDMQLYIQSLECMKALAPRVLCPAHGGVIREPLAKLDEYIRHRLWREERVLDAVRARAGAGVGELTPLAYADVPPAVHPLARRSLEAHLIKLEREHRVVRGDHGWRATDVA